MISAVIWCVWMTPAQLKTSEYKVWHESKGPAARLQLLQISGQPDLLFSARTNSSVVAWSVEKREIVKTLDWGKNQIFRGRVGAFAVSPNQIRAVSGMTLGIAIWDIETGKTQWHKMPGPVNAVAFTNADEKTFVTGIGTIITVWNVESIVAEEFLPCHSDVCSLGYSSDSRRIVAGHEDGSITVCDAQTLIPDKFKWKVHSGEVLNAVFIDRDKKILSVAYDGTVLVTEIETGKKTKLHVDKDGVSAAAYARKKNWIVVGSYGGKVSVIDVGNGKTVFTEAFQESVLSVAISDTGSVLAVATGSEIDDTTRDSRNAVMKWWKLKE